MFFCDKGETFINQVEGQGYNLPPQAGQQSLGFVLAIQPLTYYYKHMVLTHLQPYSDL
jgi:hypothetical protein